MPVTKLPSAPRRTFAGKKSKTGATQSHDTPFHGGRGTEEVAAFPRSASSRMNSESRPSWSGEPDPPENLLPAIVEWDSENAVGPSDRVTHLREAARSLSTALYHVIHQPTAKGRDRSLAALVALIYGPTPFGGVNTLREVAVRYGMTEQNLFRLMKAHRELLKGNPAPEYEI
jgi:hypothetical protein